MLQFPHHWRLWILLLSSMVLLGSMPEEYQAKSRQQKEPSTKTKFFSVWPDIRTNPVMPSTSINQEEVRVCVCAGPVHWSPEAKIRSTRH